MKKSNTCLLKETCTKIFITCLLISFCSIKSFGQNRSLSFEIASEKTGNGCGGNIAPSLSFSYHKSTFILGPNFQRKRMNFSGVQLNYRFSVVKSYNEKKEIFLTGNLTYHTSAYMSDSNVEIEKSSHKEEHFKYDELRFKVIEGYAGFGLKLNPTKNFSTAFSSGLGVYNTLDKNYDREMFREKTALVLQVRFTLIYNFKTW